MRKKVSFWLDLNNSFEKLILQEVQYLKAKRIFTQTIRDGFRLIHDLRNHRVDVLLELFPWIEDYFCNDNNINKLDEKLEAHLNKVQSFIMQQGAIPVTSGQLPSRTPIPKIESKNIEIEIKNVGNTENNNSAWNFMISSAALQGSYDNLPQKVIDYGVQTGKISISTVKQKSANTSGPKAMNVPQFTPPGFDDLDISVDAG